MGHIARQNKFLFFPLYILSILLGLMVTSESMTFWVWANTITILVFCPNLFPGFLLFPPTSCYYQRRSSFLVVPLLLASCTTQGPARAWDVKQAGAPPAWAQLCCLFLALAYSSLFTFLFLKYLTAWEEITPQNLILLSLITLKILTYKTPLSLRNNTYLCACALSHFRPCLTFETLWFLHPAGF